jgi:hypothetical protein
MNDTPRSPSIDRLTLIAIAAVAYVLANIAHEGVGHGGSCLLLGGQPVALSTFLGEDQGRLRRARELSLIPYLAGGLLYVLAGLPNPLGFSLVPITAVAAAFGGASGLAWMTQLLHGYE